MIYNCYLLTTKRKHEISTDLQGHIKNERLGARDFASSREVLIEQAAVRSAATQTPPYSAAQATVGSFQQLAIRIRLEDANQEG